MQMDGKIPDVLEMLHVDDHVDFEGNHAPPLGHTEQKKGERGIREKKRRERKGGRKRAQMNGVGTVRGGA